MKDSYHLNIDFVTGEIFYSSKCGLSRSIKLDYQVISENIEFMDNFRGRDAYMIGTFQAARNVGKCVVSVKERQYRYYSLISMLFSAIMIISNILSTKLVNFFGLTVAGAMLVYPFSYIFDYILTEVYGYQNARRTILSTALCLLLFDISLYLLIHLPASNYWHYQEHIEYVFNRMLRTFLSSTVVFIFSFFLSSYIFQKIKIKTEGKGLFKRVFYSLAISEVIETWLFCILAFYGTWPLEEIARYMIWSFFTKVTFELIVYGILTKPLVQYIKKQEKSDIIDWGTNFSPLKWEVNYDESNNIYPREA